MSSELPTVDLPALLKQRREALGLTLRQAAVIGKCSDAWLCQLETGAANIRHMQIDSLPKVAAAYKLSLPILLRLLSLLPLKKVSTCPPPV